MTPTQSGTAGITTAGISAVLAWLLPLIVHVAPPADVTMALGALVLWVGHVVASRIGSASGAKDTPSQPGSAG